MNLATAIKLYAAAGTGSEGSSLINVGRVNDEANGPQVKDISRQRLVKSNPDVDGAKDSPDSQSDNAAMVGKPYRVVDKSYGHVVSEWDTEEEAKHAALGRPYSIVVGPNTTDSFQLQSNQKVRDMARRKLLRKKRV
jgi:hypothetical protein